MGSTVPLAFLILVRISLERRENGFMWFFFFHPVAPSWTCPIPEAFFHYHFWRLGERIELNPLSPLPAKLVGCRSLPSHAEELHVFETKATNRQINTPIQHRHCVDRKMLYHWLNERNDDCFSNSTRCGHCNRHRARCLRIYYFILFLASLFPRSPNGKSSDTTSHLWGKLLPNA